MPFNLRCPIFCRIPRGLSYSVFLSESEYLSALGMALGEDRMIEVVACDPDCHQALSPTFPFNFHLLGSGTRDMHCGS